jgi:hypothetical protein
MTAPPRWDRCVSHRGKAAEQFLRDYFGQGDRRPVLIAGAGFDPRATQLAKLLAATANDRLTALFLREDRPDPNPELLKRADENEQLLKKVVPGCTVERFDVFDMDTAPVGGRRATSLVHRALKVDGVTDMVLDCSALSAGVMFPIAKYCCRRAESLGDKMNLHVLVLDDPATDGAIEACPCEQASPFHTFQGGLGLEGSAGAARLWLPQLGPGNRRLLTLVHQSVNPHAVCPILPFPATHPRYADRLIEEYGDLFETVAAPFRTTWQVDARDLVYAHEKSPLDLYRTILRIDDARRRVFAQTGGSQIILTPVGSKAVALGMFMAAIERDFAVVSVEAIEYKPDPAIFAPRSDFHGELVHIWLHGQAYNGSGNREVGKP